MTKLVFTNTLMNIFSKYIPNRYVTFDEQEPPYMTEKKIYLQKLYI